MKFLLASDLDGTIYRHRKTLPEDMEAIAEWQRRGHYFCLSSGRAPLSGIAEMEKCGLHPDLLICGNGAACIDMDGNFHFRSIIPADAPRQLFSLAREYRVSAFNGQDENGALWQHSYVDPTRVNISIEDLLKIPAFIQFNAVFKDQPEDAAAFAARVNQEIAGVTAHPNGVYIDCSADTVHKGTGVAEAARILGVSPDHCYAIGDNKNDLPMLLAYHSAVISEGDPETIAQVGRTAPNIATFIHEILG